MSSVHTASSSAPSSTSGGGHGGGGGGGNNHHGPARGPPHEMYAEYLNIAIWGIFALLVIASIPRAYARYRHPVARLTVRIKGSSSKASTIPPPTPPRARQDTSDSSEKSKDKSGFEASELNLPEALEGPFVPHNLPSRIASWEAHFHPITRYLSRPFFTTGYSIQQAIVMTVWTSIICFMCLLWNLPTYGPRRAGWVAIGQFPLVFALGAKNGLVGFLLGFGYQKLNVWHRWVGKTLFLASMFHVVGYIVIFTTKGVLTLVLPTQKYGWIAFAGMCLLAIVSLPPIRRSAYGLFWHSHWVGYLMMILGGAAHSEDIWKYSVAAGVIVVFDQICRLFKTTFVMANITAIPELKCTRIEVPHLTRGWRAGQHVRLRVISGQMGFFDIWEAHPLTIASVAESASGEGLVLYAKAAGDWTQRLYDVARGVAGEAVAESSLGVTLTGTASMRMVLEGPYGGPGHDVLSSFSAAFIVAGGSGITFGLSAIDEIIREAEAGRAKMDLIHLVWIVQDPSSLFHLLPVLQGFLDRVARLQHTDMEIRVHYTRAISTILAQTIENGITLPLGIELHPGRPKVSDLLSQLVHKVSNVDEGKSLSGIAVGCCGPQGLRDDVRDAERSIRGLQREAVGGLELVEEMFGW